MKRKWRYMAVGLVLVAILAVGWLWLQQREKPATGALTRVTAPVQRGTIAAAISGTGSIEPAERKTIAAAKAGTVAEVRFKDGDLVRKGDVLVTFEREDDNAERQIENKEISLEKAKLDLESLQLQYKNAMRADENTEPIMLNIRSKELDIRQLEQEIADLKEQDAGPDPIKAPIDGKLTGFDVEAGDLLRENAELGEVVNFGRLKLVVRVDELDIAKVEPGQRVEVRADALPDRVFEGTVAEIADEGATSNGVATFDVTVLLAEADGLKAGMSAEATITTMEKKDALYVPIEAVQSVRGQYFVFVPGEEENARPEGETPAAGSIGERLAARMRQTGMKRVRVEVGVHNEDFIEIVSGLAEGDTVILPMAVSGETRQNVPAVRMGGFRGGAGFPEGGFPAGRDEVTRGGGMGGAVPGGPVPGGGISGGGFPGGAASGGPVSGGGR